ncbi:MBL fold metallo-hydrolase [Vibrio parahaemolyticus]|uniref:ComEC/Rec2 family competence protein n=1 Tax=Vibrio parahaemolyticus TaxID=670 RepID=UPI003B66CBAC
MMKAVYKLIQKLVVATTLLSCFLLVPPSAMASVKVRIVDIGAGLCVLTHDTLEDRFFLYDAGRWDNRICSDYVNTTVDGKDIDLVVISHPDSDHLSNLEQILTRNDAQTIIHTGYPRFRVASWRKANNAISESAERGATIFNLRSIDIDSIQSPIAIGNMSIELMSGAGDWDGSHLAENERRNAISIALKLTAYGKSVFFAGDLVGRHEKDPEDTCSFSEEKLVSSGKNLASDVLIAPHHGANNASSSCLLRAISPSYIVFSAGHNYQHPRVKTVERITNILDIPESNMFRTDRGDDEGHKEWDYMRIDNCKDKPGDDDIEIMISPSSELTVDYLDVGEESCV